MLTSGNVIEKVMALDAQDVTSLTGLQLQKLSPLVEVNLTDNQIGLLSANQLVVLSNGSSSGQSTGAAIGTEGMDKLVGTMGNNVLFGRWGDDLLVASKGTDVFVGGAGNDTLQINVTPGTGGTTEVPIPATSNSPTLAQTTTGFQVTDAAGAVLLTLTREAGGFAVSTTDTNVGIGVTHIDESVETVKLVGASGDIFSVDMTHLG